MYDYAPTCTTDLLACLSASTQNTATLPHKKYYDYDKWEMEGKVYRISISSHSCSLLETIYDFSLVWHHVFLFIYYIEYQKQKAKEAKLNVSGNTVLADEARHKREQQERARAQQEAERRALYGSMSREKVEEMKHQARLRSQMQMAYKTGDKATYQRLKERLEADE
jgi:hypothetical protein